MYHVIFAWLVRAESREQREREREREIEREKAEREMDGSSNIARVVWCIK
jgi:hypothetical protein